MKDSEDRVNNIFLGPENDQEKITLNTLLILSELKELKEIILDQKEGDLKLKDNQEIEEKFEEYPDNVGPHTFRVNTWVLKEFLQLVNRKDWKIQTSITKALLLFINKYKDDEDKMNENY
jgi:hypothetical protein